VRRATIIVLGALVGCGGRAVPGVITPERPTRAAPQGKDRGDIEIALGSVTTGVAATLVGLGAYAAWRSVKIREYCDAPPDYIDEAPDDGLYDSVCSDLTGADPARAMAISSGLSFAFAVPIAVGGAFLLRKGVRMRKAWKRVQGLSLQPWAPAGRGAGVTFGFAF
jgi:hypothetical protein